jgi:hypothetical protein
MDTFTNFDYLKLYPFNIEIYQFQNYMFIEEIHKKYVFCHLKYKSIHFYYIMQYFIII